MKQCSKCGEVKPHCEFYTDARHSDGLASSCKACHRVVKRHSDMRRAYGIEPAEFEAMLTAQRGRCAICGSPCPGGRGDWHVDHDHQSGAVRGLLCSNCNIGLGQFKDDPALLRAAAEYLTNNRKEN